MSKCLPWKRSVDAVVAEEMIPRVIIACIIGLGDILTWSWFFFFILFADQFSLEFSFRYPSSSKDTFIKASLLWKFDQSKNGSNEKLIYFK